MFSFPYLVEILTPKRNNSINEKLQFNVFAERYYRILDMGFGLSIPDNPMGQPRYSLLEMIEHAHLPVTPDNTIMNLNTFHTKEELDGVLGKASDIGLKYLLVVRGDGGPKLSKLDPDSIGGVRNVATSIDLLRYINREYRGKFVTGCAFNHYNPLAVEADRLKSKIDAGAKFVITQPVIGKDPNVDSIFGFGIPVVIEAWMSTNLALLFKSVRKRDDEGPEHYDPPSNLSILHRAYPDCCIYLSMLGFRREWRRILPRSVSGSSTYSK
jgi:methylenetetrahydrofolate reductase (NADPH)